MTVSGLNATMGTFTSSIYSRITDLLAKLQGCQFGEELDRGTFRDVGPRWTASDAEAFQLLAVKLRGYYEAREGTSEHCFVIGHDYGEAVVVPLREHGTKARALRYAIVLAVATIERGRRQKQIDEIGAPQVYQQSVTRPDAKPRHDWLAWYNKPIETSTLYRGVYPAALHSEISAMSIRPLEPADAPAMEWSDRLALALLREDGAVLHSKYGQPEIGSLDDGGGITWILVPDVAEH